VSSFNSVCLLGNVTRDIECKYLQSGTAVCDIGLAVNEKRKSGDEWIDEVSFIDCTAFGRTAEIAGEFLDKGSQVLINGRLKQERWERDGQKNSKVKVIVDKLVLLGQRRRDEHDQTDERETHDQLPASTPAPPPLAFLDDIPF
jgi:single-strand DNA-binding protein